MLAELVSFSAVRTVQLTRASQWFALTLTVASYACNSLNNLRLSCILVSRITEGNQVSGRQYLETDSKFLTQCFFPIGDEGIGFQLNTVATGLV